MLRLAGFSAGRSVCARGGWSAGRASLLRRLAFDRACCLTHSAKQDGLRYVAFLFRRGSGSPVARSRIAGAVIRLGWFTLGLRVFCGDPDGSTRGRGDGGGAAWVRFCVIILALRRFPRGVRWGEMWKPHCGRAPDCAKESSTLWTLFIWVVMWVRFTRGRRCGYNGELAGHSWIEGSACVCVTQPSSWPSRSLS